MAQNPSNLNYGAYVQSSGGRSRPRRSSSQPHSTQVPETQSPAVAASSSLPTQLSIEDFVSQQGRECLTRIHPHGIW